MRCSPFSTVEKLTQHTFRLISEIHTLHTRIENYVFSPAPPKIIKFQEVI